MSVSNQRTNISSHTNTNNAEEPTTTIINNDKADTHVDVTMIGEPSRILQLIEKLSTTTNSIELQIIINNHVSKQICSIFFKNS